MTVSLVLTVLTVLRGGLSCDALIRMIRVPARPSRLNVISMPSVRSEVCARRNRPKAELNEAVEKLDNRLTAVESKIGGIHNRIDDETLKPGNLENRVRSAVPNLPPPPERV
jgi:hypothetical protein